jgi:hypothetical protein
MGNSDRALPCDSRPVTGRGQCGLDIETRVCRPPSSGKKARPDRTGCGKDGEATRLYRSGELTGLLEPDSKPIPSSFPRATPGSGEEPIASGLPRTEIAAPGVNVQMQSLVSARLDRNPAVFRPGSFERRSIVLLVVGVATFSFLFWSFRSARGPTPIHPSISPQAAGRPDGVSKPSPPGKTDRTNSIPGSAADTAAARPESSPASDASGVAQDDEERAVDEREAVDLLIEGRRVEALVSYQRLAAANPAQPAYAALVDLLTRQIGERCAERAYSSDERCGVPQ